MLHIMRGKRDAGIVSYSSLPNRVCIPSTRTGLDYELSVAQSCVSSFSSTQELQGTALVQVLYEYKYCARRYRFHKSTKPPLFVGS